MDQSVLKIKIKGDSMWPSLNDGDEVECLRFFDQEISVKDLIVFKHPFKSSVTCLKRVKSISSKGIFVEGDNPDPLASEDSHNFGLVKIDSIIALKKS